MTECNHEALSFSNCRKRQARVNFSGGSISSNGGALSVREVDRRMGLTAAVARALGDRRQRGKVPHEVLTMVRQRVHAVASGYEDLNDHDALRADPLVQMACERAESLASSSTLCRFEQRAERDLNFDLLQFQRRSGAHGSRATRRDRPTKPRDRVRPGSNCSLKFTRKQKW